MFKVVKILCSLTTVVVYYYIKPNNHYKIRENILIIKFLYKKESIHLIKINCLSATITLYTPFLNFLVSKIVGSLFFAAV